MNILSEGELSILKELLARWRPDLLELLNRSHLTDDEREELRGALSEELVSRGLDRDSWEPTAYGLQLEDLIDKVGRLDSGPPA